MTDKILVEAKTSTGAWEKICTCEDLAEWESIKDEMMEVIGESEYRVSQVCEFCGESFELDESICGCPESLDYTEEWRRDRAADLQAYADHVRETMEDR